MTEFTDIFNYVYKNSRPVNEHVLVESIKENDLHFSTMDVSNNLIMFDLDIFLEENFKSYKYKSENIWSQFEQDCPRSCITFNKLAVTNKLNIQINHNNTYNKYNLLDTVGMLCNQSSFAFPYFFLSKLYNKDKTVLLSSNSDRCIDITYSDDIESKELPKNQFSTNVSITTKFDFRNLYTNTVAKIVTVVITLDLTKKPKKYGIMNWFWETSTI